MPDLNGKGIDISLKTPTKPTTKEEFKIQTPSTPAAYEFDLAVQKSPKGKSIHFDSIVLKKMGAEIIYLLMKGVDGEEETLETDGEHSIESLSLSFICFHHNSTVKWQHITVIELITIITRAAIVFSHQEVCLETRCPYFETPSGNNL